MANARQDDTSTTSVVMSFLASQSKENDGKWTKVDPTIPKHLSLNYRSLTLKETPTNQPKSAHEVKLYIDDAGKSWHLKFADVDPTTGQLTLKNQMATLMELLSYEICRTVAPELTPEVKLVFKMNEIGSGEQIIGLATESMNFLSNKDAPLKTTDILIKCLAYRPIQLIQDEIQSVSELVKSYHDYLKNYINKKNSQPLVGSGWTGLFGIIDYSYNFTKSTINTRINPNLTSDQLKLYFDNELIKLDNPKNLLDIDSFKVFIKTLLLNLRSREKHILALQQQGNTNTNLSKSLGKDEYSEEKEFLNKIKSSLEKLERLLELPETPQYNVQQIEQLYLTLKTKKINMEILQDESYAEVINGEAIKISAEDLRIYIKQRTLAIVLAMRWLCEDPDSHNNNIGNFILDCDMFWFRVTSELKEQGLLDSIPQIFTSANLDINAVDIVKFPELSNWLGYCATSTYKGKDTIKQVVTTVTTLSGSQADKAKNWFSREDSHAFRQLNLAPAFHFHFFATMLGFLVASNLFKEVTDVFAPEAKGCWKSHDNLIGKSGWRKGETLFDAITRELENRPKELKNKVFNIIPTELSAKTEFENFIKDNGDFVKQHIVRVLETYHSSIEKSLPSDSQECLKLKNSVNELIKNIDRVYASLISAGSVTSASLIINEFMDEGYASSAAVRMN